MSSEDVFEGRTMHFVTPLKGLLILGENAIREAVEHGDTELDFLQEIQLATAGLYARLAQGKDIGVQTLFLGSHAQSLWLAAVRATYSGQGYAAPSILRTALESICYAYLISKNPSLATDWSNRNDGPEQCKRSRKSFNGAVGDAKTLLDKEDPMLGDWIHWLYEKLIDEGAHPNPKGLWARPNTLMTGDAEPIHYQETTDWFHRESHVTRRYVLDCVTVGSCLFRVSAAVLKAPESAFRERFQQFSAEAKKLREVFNAGAQG